MSNRQCPGEYDVVYAASMNKERLYRAHQTPCTIEMTYFLVAYMHELHKNEYVTGKGKPPQVKFRKRHIAGKRVRSHAIFNLKHQWKYLSLPHVSYDHIVHKNQPLGTLRVGVVCHEFAHLISWQPEDVHGRLFTITLDQLLYETEKFWSNVEDKTNSSERTRQAAGL